MATFTVDTHLFRELGELLVGRDSTALIELIKNSYDADATEVVVYGEALTSLSRGFIRIHDNGIGMSRDEFERGFLRIASRTKESSDRRSLVFQRRFTGAKGIGRLAAHKLARVLEIQSNRWNGDLPRSGPRGQRLPAKSRGLEASIDWNEIEARQTLDEIEGSDAITLGNVPLPTGASAGTTITLRRLRREWTASEHSRFLEEIQAFEPPQALIQPIPRTVVQTELLFRGPIVRDVAKSSGSEFRVRLEGELAPPDNFWIAIVNAANWVIEISAERASGLVRYAIAPTAQTQAVLPDATVRTFEIPHPFPQHGPFFQARILKRTGVQRGREDLKQWAGRTSGIRVFLEGFRILPYGEPRNDWLFLDRDATERDRGILNRSMDPQLQLQLSDQERDSSAGLTHLPNKHYVGAVFLTERNAPLLKMLVNREGFVPDANYQALTDIVRRGIDLCTRVQAAATHEIRSERREIRAAQKIPSTDSPITTMPTAAAIESTAKEARAHAEHAKRLVATGRWDAATRAMLNAVDKIDRVAGVSNELAEEAAMTRVLASVGTQLASFVHEINGLLGIARAVDKALTEIRTSIGLSASHRQDLSRLHRSVTDLKRTLERHASYLVDIMTPDARRRRSRQSLSKRLDAGIRLVAFAAERRDIKIINKIPTDLKSPPMFPAEVTAVFTNLLTNAVKAAGSKGRILVTGKRRRDGAILVRMENTGTRVKLKEGERWFRPFESSTTEVDPILGQGMGLGLPITRSMLEEYGATIHFVEPSAGFSTAVEIILPD